MVPNYLMMPDTHYLYTTPSARLCDLKRAWVYPHPVPCQPFDTPESNALEKKTLRLESDTCTFPLTSARPPDTIIQVERD